VAHCDNWLGGAYGTDGLSQMLAQHFSRRLVRKTGLSPSSIVRRHASATPAAVKLLL
jgi:hypothetical protein